MKMIDPPYDSEFNEYAQNKFYRSLGFNMVIFEKKYSVNFMNRMIEKLSI